jgi:hypothetical protein
MSRSAVADWQQADHAIAWLTPLVVLALALLATLA